MRCPKCDLDNPPGKIVCARCGTRLRSAAAAAGAGAAGSPENVALFMQRLRGDLVRLGIVTVFVAAVALALGMFLR